MPLPLVRVANSDLQAAIPQHTRHSGPPHTTRSALPQQQHSQQMPVLLMLPFMYVLSLQRYSESSLFHCDSVDRTDDRRQTGDVLKDKQPVQSVPQCCWRIQAWHVGSAEAHAKGSLPEADETSGRSNKGQSLLAFHLNGLHLCHLKQETISE